MPFFVCYILSSGFLKKAEKERYPFHYSRYHFVTCSDVRLCWVNSEGDPEGYVCCQPDSYEVGSKQPGEISTPAALDSSGM